MKYSNWILSLLCFLLVSFSSVSTLHVLSATAQTQTSTPDAYLPQNSGAEGPEILFSPEEEAYLQAKKRISMCVDPDWMPLEKIENGVHVGMTADYIALFQQNISIPIVLVPTINWRESIEYAKARKCDIFSLAMPTPERDSYMEFSQPYLNIPLVMAARADMPFIDDITSLDTFKLGVVRGYAFGEIIRNRFPKLNIADVDSVDQGLQYVSTGKLDGFIGTLATVGYSIQRKFPSELKVAGKFDERWTLGIATRNDEPLLLSIFEKVISAIDREEHQRILNHWVSVKFVQGTDYTLLWRVLLVFTIGVLFLLWRNNVLHKYSLKLKEQNEQIREGEERYREIYNAPSDAIVMHDADTGKIIDANKGMLDMFGYTYEEALQVDLNNISSGEYPYTMEEAGRKIQNTVLHGPQTFEWMSRKKDGALFWSEVALKYTEFSGRRYVIAVVRNIADRKQAEESLYFTQFAIDNSTDSAFWSGQDGKFIYVNDAACQSLGYSRKELMTMNVSGFDPNFPFDAWADHWKDLKEKGSINLETFHQTKDGRIFPVEVMATFMEYEGKEFNCSFVRDISERKQAEKNLAAEKEWLAVTLRSIGDGVITTDISGNIVLLNKVTEKLTGWSNQEATGRPLEEVFNIINEQTRVACENPVAKVISSGQVVGLANHTLLVARDGTERNIADSGAPILDSESNVVGVVLVFRDVTEQVKTEKELLKAKKLESIGVLAGGIAHDFNNILAAILGNINLALFDEKLKDETKKLLSEAEKASLRAKDLTQQLLTFAKGGEPVKEISSLENVIKDSANFVLHGDKVACKFNIPGNLRLVDIDKGQISQVIQNIVLNASHAMPEGGIVTITCENVTSCDNPKGSTLSKGLFVKLSIQDEGIGMPANVAEKIFDPYFSTKQEGSGLGLAITQSIILKHGGHISVESFPGVGTTFTLYLPASEHEKVKGQESEEHRNTCSQAKILIMDDDEMVRNVAKAMLVQLGHEVVLASDGGEAVKLYLASMDSGKLFNLVIMDLTVPGGMGGEEAVQKIINIDPKAKVIVSSGYSNDPIMANFNDFGFCSAIVKPYQLQELSKEISQALD